MEITTKTIKSEVYNYEGPVLLECWASWCIPCKTADPVLQKLSEEYKGKCKVLKINVDKNPQVSKDLNVKGLPSFILFVNGEEEKRLVASQPESSLRNLVEEGIEKYNNENQESSTDNDDSELSEEEEQRIIEERLKNLGYL